MWHELKEYIRQEAKPKTKNELVEGMSDLWATINATKCIDHLRKFFLESLIWMGLLLKALSFLNWKHVR